MKSKLLALLLGFSIFLTYTFGGAFFQRYVMDVDGSVLKIVSALILGFIFVQAFKLELRGRNILLASLTVYFWSVLFHILLLIAADRGDSIAKIIFQSAVVELITLAGVSIALVILSSIVKKSDG